MASIVLTVQDESMLNQLKKACMMLKGVVSVKVQKSEPKEYDVTKTAGYREAMEDVRLGRVYHAESVEDMFNQILG
ncbi:MAG: response regulator [Prevotella sp.]|nr:response regulator [Prevotella sp.]